MASNVIRVSVLADAKQLDREFGNAGKSAQSFGDRLGLLGKVAVAALAVKALSAVKDFVGDSVRAFSDLNESINAVNVIYGEHADAVLELGKKAADSLGVSNSAFNSWAVSMGAFAKQIAGDGGDAAAVVDEMSQRIADFASVMNLDFEEASQKFQSGLAGQSRPLREFGIDVSDANIKAFALANGIGEVGRELTEGEKVQARYGTIMEQTAATAGDFAKTADDLANKQRILAAHTENTKAALGEKLAPAMHGINSIGLELIETFAVLVGAIEAVDKTATQLARNHGWAELEDNITDLSRGIEDLGSSQNILQWKALVDTFPLASRAIKDLDLSTEELSNRFGLSSTQAKVFTRALDEQLEVIDAELRRDNELQLFHNRWQGHLQSTGRATGGLSAAQGDLEDATDDVTDSVYEQVSAHERLQAKMDAQLGPLYALRDAQLEVEEAQDAVTEAVAEYGDGSPEHVQALIDQKIAFDNLKLTQVEAATQSGLTREAFRANLEAARIHTKEEIDLIIAEFDRVNAFQFQRKTVTVDTRWGAGQGVRDASGLKFHEGGVVPGPKGHEVTATLKGGETVLPTHKSDFALKTGGSSDTGGNTYNITVNALDPKSAAKAVVQALQEYERRNGAIPVNVRQ